MNSLPLALRIAARELRGGITGFRIFTLCLALGVAMIAGVGSLGAAIEAGLKADARALLGGDAEFSLVHRTATADELAFLASQGQVSRVMQLRGMARTVDGAIQAFTCERIRSRHEGRSMSLSSCPLVPHRHGHARLRGDAAYLHHHRDGVAGRNSAGTGRAPTASTPSATTPDRANCCWIAT